MIQFCFLALMSLYNYNDARLIDAVNSRANLAPPELVYAMIAVESGYNPFATSDKDAAGFMQVTPIAVQEIRNRWEARFTKVLNNDKLSQREAVFIRNCKLPKKELLNRYRPDQNIQLGMCYLSLQLERYSTYELALASYNGGHRQAMRAVEGKPMVSETANYVVKVMNIVNQYTKKECK